MTSENKTSWSTRITLQIFATLLGSLVTIFFLEAVGAINVLDFSAAPVRLKDLLGPLISATGIVVTALLAWSGWTRQQDESRAQREEESRRRRNMAKVDRIPLSHILDEIIDTCWERGEALAAVKYELVNMGAGVERSRLPMLEWPENLVERIRNVARYQEGPLLDFLLILVNDLQVKKARSGSFDRKVVSDLGLGHSVSSRVRNDYFKELFELHVVCARCFGLFDAARDRSEDTEGVCAAPTEELFWNAARRSGWDTDNDFHRESGLLFNINGGVLM